MYTIYRLVNTVTGSFYIGCTGTLKGRVFSEAHRAALAEGHLHRMQRVVRVFAFGGPP